MSTTKFNVYKLNSEIRIVPVFEIKGDGDHTKYGQSAKGNKDIFNNNRKARIFGK